METIIKPIVDNGILVVIAGVFLYSYLNDKKEAKNRDAKYNESLSLLSKSSDNIAKSLDLLTRSMDENKELLNRHDERSVKINENVLLINEKLGEVKTIVDKCRKGA